MVSPLSAVNLKEGQLFFFKEITALIHVDKGNFALFLEGGGFDSSAQRKKINLVHLLGNISLSFLIKP